MDQIKQAEYEKMAQESEWQEIKANFEKQLEAIGKQYALRREGRQPGAGSDLDQAEQERMIKERVLQGSQENSVPRGTSEGMSGESNEGKRDDEDKYAHPE